jgi:oxygen-dependent protoporphyrinogen oxidase
MGSIPHSGSAIWTFGYRTEDVPRRLDAFGFLVPKHERVTIMACTWVATKWQGRVPEGKAVLRCFSTDPDVSEEAMRTDLRRLMGITAQPIFALNNRWPAWLKLKPASPLFQGCTSREMPGTESGFPTASEARNGWRRPLCEWAFRPHFY